MDLVLDPATVIRGNANLNFVSTVAKTIISKKSVLPELKTRHPVSNQMEMLISPSNKTTGKIPMCQVMRVRVNCMQVFSCRLNDSSH